MARTAPTLKLRAAAAALPIFAANVPPTAAKPPWAKVVTTPQKVWASPSKDDIVIWVAILAMVFAVLLYLSLNLSVCQ
ncbi:hypothetical protein F4679DRAFT_535440 [Xylaria curta]|nr:hypothetical protein F4679DRAFT_535440 [Xylaria curta]